MLTRGRQAFASLRDLTAIAAIVACVTGCYTGARTTADINAAWRGRTRTQIEAEWGRPAEAHADGDRTALVWIYTRRGIALPTVDAAVDIGPGYFEAHGAIIPGRRWKSTTEVIALLDASGAILSVHGPSLRWGPPDDANIHWGTLFGAHVGMGRLDDTSTALPSGGLYIGGMLSRTLGLVGTFSLVSGTDEAGAAMGFAWGLAAQRWLDTRLWVRVGPAAILAFDPGFENIGFQPGVTTGASYALIKAGTFALDLRLDVTVGPSVVLGNAGIGVNLN